MAGFCKPKHVAPESIIERTRHVPTLKSLALRPHSIQNNKQHNDCAKANAADTMKNGRAHLLYTNKGVMLCIQASLR